VLFRSPQNPKTPLPLMPNFGNSNVVLVNLEFYLADSKTWRAVQNLIQFNLSLPLQLLSALSLGFLHFKLSLLNQFLGQCIKSLFLVCFNLLLVFRTDLLQFNFNFLVEDLVEHNTCVLRTLIYSVYWRHHLRGGVWISVHQAETWARFLLLGNRMAQIGITFKDCFDLGCRDSLLRYGFVNLELSDVVAPNNFRKVVLLLFNFFLAHQLHPLKDVAHAAHHNRLMTGTL
jgi:hypothetical protein